MIDLLHSNALEHVIHVQQLLHQVGAIADISFSLSGVYEKKREIGG